MSKNFRNKKNTLLNFILNDSSKEYSKQTIIGLFRSILEPLIEAPSQEGLVLFRLNDLEGVSSVIKRIEFSGAAVYSFNDNLNSDKILNIEKENIWESVEFVMVLAPRYSAVLVWDYSSAQKQEFSEICLIYNSKTVADVAKVIFNNSTIDLNEYLTTFAPDRRENNILNVSINKIVNCFNSVNEEIVMNEAEKETLVKSEEMLQEYEYTSDKAKFIAHEIKNHLSIIDLYAKIAEKRINSINLDDENQKSINNAITNIRNAKYAITQFVNELKNFARPILVEKKLIPIIDDVINLTLPKANEKNICIEKNCKEDVRIHIDEIKFQSVLINLIYNAIEAIDENKKITISFEQKKNNFAQIIVSDNGDGIKEDIQDKIFHKGFTTKSIGNGLGLHICKTLMKEQYGEINLLKSDSNGTHFEVLIPII